MEKYNLNEGNEALNRVLLMMRYDLGKTLSENVVLEQMPEPEDMKEKPEYGGKIQKISQKTFPAKEMTLDEFMENYRETLSNPFMIGLEIALTSTGVGVTAVVAAYTALLAYDVYKGITTGDWGWLNIVSDVLGIVSSGILSSTIRPIIQGAKGLKLNTLGKVLEYLSKTKIWTEIKPYLVRGVGALKSISKGIWKFLSWISKKTGFRQLKVAGKSIEVTIHNIIYNIEEFLKSSVKKTVKFFEPGEKATIRQGTKHAIITGGSIYGFNNFIEKYINPKLSGGKIETTIPDDDRLTEELKFHIRKNNKEYFAKEIGKIEFVTDKNKDLIKLKIDGNFYQMINPMMYKLKKI